MKCPECGGELDKGYICEKCGKKLEPSQEGFEVEYKKFKISEFMEIRKKSKKSKKTSMDDLTDQILAYDTVKKKTHTEKEKGIFDSKVERDAPHRKRNIFIAIFLLLIMLIIGIYYLLTFIF